MAGPRANWKGFIRFGEVSAPVALYSASTATDRMSFNILNKKTGNRVRREYFDSETEKPIEKDDQIKGYEIENGRFVTLEPSEVAAAVPESDKTITVLSFIPHGEIDTVYFDKPYYLAPDKFGDAAFSVFRDGMRRAGVSAIGRTVLFRRMRTLLISPEDEGLLATTLNFDYEVRSAEEAFEDIPSLNIEGEMLDLAKHIIRTKIGVFRPEEFTDRYEAALSDLVKAKMEGRTVAKPAAPAVSKPSDLLVALRESADLLGKASQSRRKITPSPSPSVGGEAKRKPSSRRKTG
ncbi:Ku protein [Pararhizobium sp. BT-229]|uniref:non-homologous end joining protein Ku n=1 Tax=Pararhizobium sp. BT-229 TaxID=2986923 RepID=UPI0021F6C61C|nr:Ku protein [Pararhizobium sp. BT-229]MCV9964775.1 Ku protein [Pararhizobium sp. BT-229]